MYLMAKYGEAAAEEDLARARIYRSTIMAKARQYSIDPAFIAAIGSRETRWSQHYFLGDIDPVTKIPHGCGPLQIDDRSFPDWCTQYRAGELTPIDGIDKGCQVIVSKRAALFGEHGLINDRSLDQSMRLRCIAAAYNSGEGRVAKLINGAIAACPECGYRDLNPDTHTTGGNYGADVVERMTVFSSSGFILPSP